jgi:glyoxylase-like metal-dependent hydrolase (beta-lactamase superfamily II)
VPEELRPGLKRWTSTHPEWKPEEDELDESYRPVASLLYRAPETLVFVDPLVPDELWPALDAEVEAAGAPVVVLTTIHFHQRSRDEVAERYSGELDRLPDGVRSFPAERGNEVALWLEGARALVFGDAVLGDQQGGLRVAPWFRTEADRERTVAALRPLLDLPIDLVLPSHGRPVLVGGRDALADALGS